MHPSVFLAEQRNVVDPEITIAGVDDYLHPIDLVGVQVPQGRDHTETPLVHVFEACRNEGPLLGESDRCPEVVAFLAVEDRFRSRRGIGCVAIMRIGLREPAVRVAIHHLHDNGWYAATRAPLHPERYTVPIAGIQSRDTGEIDVE